MAYFPILVVLMVTCNQFLMISSVPTENCSYVREKISRVMNFLDDAANNLKTIGEKDCKNAQDSYKLTKYYSNCLPGDVREPMSSVSNNMRYVVKIICDNVNKRILGCFSPENLKQFNTCHNKTIQYMDFIMKQEKKETSNNSQNTEISWFEHHCCKLHLQSDCFLTKVLHQCTESSQLRLGVLFQTFTSFLVRDVVDVVCNKIESLEQCQKFVDNQDFTDELGYR